MSPNINQKSEKKLPKQITSVIAVNAWRWWYALSLRWCHCWHFSSFYVYIVCRFVLVLSRSSSLTQRTNKNSASTPPRRAAAPCLGPSRSPPQTATAQVPQSFHEMMKLELYFYPLTVIKSGCCWDSRSLWDLDSQMFIVMVCFFHLKIWLMNLIFKVLISSFGMKYVHPSTRAARISLHHCIEAHKQT